MKVRWRRTSDGALSVVLIALWWVFLAPVAIGGPASFVIVHGRSMEPAYSAGDLVVARAASEYRVDDIVIFRAPDQRRYIIHRIVGGDAVEGWSTQGDGNVRADRWSVADDTIIGREWFVVPRVAEAVAAVQRAPVHFAATIGFAVTILALFVPPGSRRHRARAVDDDPDRAASVADGLDPPSEALGPSPFDEITDRLAAMRADLIAGQP